MGGLAVLVIDDNQARCEGLTELLTLHGFRASCAFSGSDGLAQAKASRPAALLLDLHMPDMDGVEVLAAIRDDPSMSNTAVVLLTAEEAPIATHGSDTFLTYPIDMTTLKTVLLGSIARRAKA